MAWTVPAVLHDVPRDGASQVRARDKSEILACRRCWNGIERFDEVKYALLRPDGQIAIVPKTGKGPRVARSQ